MTMILRANYPDSYENGASFDKAVLAGYDLQPTIFDKIFNVMSPAETPAKDRVRMAALSGVGSPVLVAEGAEIVPVAPTQGYDKTIVFDTFAQAQLITDQAMADDQLGMITRNIQQFGVVFRQWQEDWCAGMLRSGFVTTTYTGGDGLALFSASHTYPGAITAPNGATTQSNTGTQPLSISALDQAISAMMETINAAGKMQSLSPRFLVVPPKLFTTADRMLGSEKLPQSSLNDRNPFNSMGITVVSYPQLAAAAGGSDTAWYLLSEPIMHSLTYWQRDLPTSEMERFTSRKATQYQVSHRAGFGFNDWRGVWGSTGTGV